MEHKKNMIGPDNLMLRMIIGCNKMSLEGT